MELLITELPKISVSASASATASATATASTTASATGADKLQTKEKKPTLCLNMIVKNESKILSRMFDAVADIIDCYCICDTGSTDNTVELITEYFIQKGIPGKIIQEPFKNFAHNRNVALWGCKGMSDYVLLLDADMILKVSEKFDKKVLTQDYYHIFQGNEAFYYQNVRIVRNTGVYAYVGVTHEYVNVPAGSKGGKVFDKKVIFIHDIGDGGAKSDKFKRDIALLEKGLEDEPLNTRYYFYLGNSYRDYGSDDKALATYQQELSMNGWAQEKYCACMSMGDIYQKKGDMVNAAKYWLKASEYDNERIEGVVKAAEYYRLRNENVVVNLLYNRYKGYKRGMAEGKLFVEQDKYRDLLEYHNSISAFYVNDKESGYACCKQIITNSLMDLALLNSTLSNLRFYQDLLLNETLEEREKLFIKIDTLLDKLILEKQVGKKSDNDIWRLLHGQGLRNNNSITDKEQDKEKKKEINWEETYQELKKYRIEGKQEEAMELYTTLTKEDPKYQEYEWKLEYEYSVFAFYLGIRNINDQVVTILNKCLDTSIITSVLSNIKFYQDKLLSEKIYDFTVALKHTINNVEYTFHSSSSCIIPYHNGNGSGSGSVNGYLLNVRFVNYTIDQEGRYHDCTPYIITLNKRIELTKDFLVIREKILDVDFTGRQYMGIEDVRIFEEKSGDINFIGTGFHQNNTIGIVQGTYDVLTNNNEKTVLHGVEITPDFAFNSTCEKNWVYVNYKDEMHVIYSWFPLKICICNDLGKCNDLCKLEIVEEKPMPDIFKQVRGSSCGFSYTNAIGQSELWFVVHLVSYETPRQYYHMLVVFDQMLNLKRYSAPFKFEGESIEYCLGLVVETDRVIMTYSTWDRTTKIGIYNKKYIDELLCYS